MIYVILKLGLFLVEVWKTFIVFFLKLDTVLYVFDGIYKSLFQNTESFKLYQIKFLLCS